MQLLTQVNAQNRKLFKSQEFSQIKQVHFFLSHLLQKSCSSLLQWAAVLKPIQQYCALTRCMLCMVYSDTG